MLTATLSSSDWIAISAIGAPIIVSFVIFTYRKFTSKKERVFYERLDKRFTELNPQTAGFNFLNKQGKIKYSQLIIAHKNMIVSSQEGIPEGIRNVDVSVVQGDDFETEITKLYKKNEIKYALKKTISTWNKWSPHKRYLNKKSKIELVSRFHTYFNVIHPFTDGNGRISMSLMDEQLSYLFDEFIEFRPDTRKYYEAIIAASKGNEKELKSLIEKEVNRNTQSKT